MSVHDGQAEYNMSGQQSAPTSVLDGYDAFKRICQLAAESDDVFSVFRRTAQLVQAMENVSNDYAQTLMTAIVGKYPELLDSLPKFRTSDDCGQPLLHDFQQHGRLAGSTVRYIYHVGELKEIFGTLDGMNIIEIGGGYGGQCKIIMDYFKVARYSIIDLPPVLAMARRYLQFFGCNSVRFLTMKELPVAARYDLLISNYAFTECNRVTQAAYLQSVFRNASNGFVKCNLMERSLGFPRHGENELLQFMPGSQKLPHFPDIDGCFTWIWRTTS